MYKFEVGDVQEMTNRISEDTIISRIRGFLKT